MMHARVHAKTMSDDEELTSSDEAESPLGRILRNYSATKTAKALSAMKNAIKEAGNDSTRDAKGRTEPIDDDAPPPPPPPPPRPLPCFAGEAVRPPIIRKQSTKMSGMKRKKLTFVEAPRAY